MTARALATTTNKNALNQNGHGVVWPEPEEFMFQFPKAKN
jgi:hypothetical protein